MTGTGLANARNILQKVGAREQMIEEICLLLTEQQEEQKGQSLPAKILHDALLLRTLQEDMKDQSGCAENVQQQVAELCTNSAKIMAASLIEENCSELH